MKKQYQKPVTAVTSVAEDDILCTSGYGHLKSGAGDLVEWVEDGA